jgi:hypothetical protein
MPASDPAAGQGAMTVEAFCRWASIGRTVAYREIGEGRLHPRKVGRRTLIPVAEAERWLATLPIQATPPLKTITTQSGNEALRLVRVPANGGKR